MDKDLNQNTAEQTTGFCGGCRSNCPLSAPNCPTGMERAGWSSEESADSQSSTKSLR